VKVMKKLSETKLKQLVKSAELSGGYAFTRHAEKRLNERKVSIQEVNQVMRNGHHEKRKDDFKLEYKSWNYAWRGKTLDGRALRLVFYVEDGLIFVTIIDLDK
jgi:hypothetical protein